ncbi:MAG: DUF11 domain-containing protein, partial [Deltaproteobacteria bacterium]|nr:DUF11 domain-containing protein [Deltaproteobacteria bacterium]
MSSNNNQPRQGAGVAGGVGGSCDSVIALTGSYDPDPVLAGGRVTFTLDFVNTSENESIQDLTLKNVLPEGMTLVSASNDGVEFGNVVTWNLGGLEP